MNKLWWVAAAIACVLIAGAWNRAVHRVKQDRQGAVESALRTGSELAHAYEQGVSARLDMLRAAGRRDELADPIASALGTASPSGATHVVHVVASDDRRNVRQDGHLYAFRTLAHYPLTVIVGVDASIGLAAAEQRRAHHYLGALLESLLALMAAVGLARLPSRAARRDSRKPGQEGVRPVSP